MELNLIIRSMEEAGIRGITAALFTQELFGEGEEFLVCLGVLPLPDARPAPSGAVGSIAPFASRHRYRRIVTALRPLSRRIREELGIPKSAVRLFSNSSLPERSLAAALGLGWVGRNGLLMNREYGSSFLIAGLAIDLSAVSPLPVSWTELERITSLDPPADLYAGCGVCRACVAACPAAAIAALSPEGGIDPDRCLQQLSTRPGLLPEAARRVWGRRIYGCQSCQEVCPVNKQRRIRAESLPPEEEHRPLAPLLIGFAEGRPLKELLPDTALEASWVPREAILRNLIIAAGESGDPTLAPLIRTFRDHPDEGVRREVALSLELLARKTGLPGGPGGVE